LVLDDEGNPSPHLKRADAGYTPADDVHTGIGWWCSDDRQWVQRAPFDEGGYTSDDDVDVENGD
jgi:hypothetical protein